MNIEEAKIILLCNNVVEVIFAQSKGALSEDLYNEEDGFDLNELKKQAIETVLAELDKKDKMIELMIKNIEQHISENVYDYLYICDKCKYDNGECHGDYCSETIKEYFEKKVGEE